MVAQHRRDRGSSRFTVRAGAHRGARTASRVPRRQAPDVLKCSAFEHELELIGCCAARRRTVRSLWRREQVGFRAYVAEYLPALSRHANRNLPLNDHEPNPRLNGRVEAGDSRMAKRLSARGRFRLSQRVAGSVGSNAGFGP
jgi:hypothetical protein